MNKNKILKESITNLFPVYAQMTGNQLKDIQSNSKSYVYIINNIPYIIIDGTNTKICAGKNYNFVFDKQNGNFKRWGTTYDEDPEFSPIGPEIYDCEVTTACQGVPNKDGIVTPCQFCYKANTPNGKNLSFENFKKIIDVFPKSLGQIAFGADSTATSNPDLWKMMAYCREIGVIPNITVANISDEVADKLKQYCGAVAVSRYANKDICYNSVEKLATYRKMSQINIHAMLSLQTFDQCMETARDIITDKRLKDMGSIVFLGLKKKGRAKNNFDIVSMEKFEELILFCFQNNIRFGFDSCSACRFEKVVRESKQIPDNIRENLIQYSESCESGAYSFYTSVECEYFPCSFTEGESGWEKGLDMLNVSDFLKDIWYHPRNVEWRNRLIKSKVNGCRQCLSFPEINI